MANDDTAPAETAIMGIVHDALRRDLDRLHRVQLPRTWSGGFAAMVDRALPPPTDGGAGVGP